VVIHDVPLLVESTRGTGYAGVIVVEAPLETRLERLEHRGVERVDAERRIALQATDEERRAVATWVIDNSGDRATLEAQIDTLWPKLQALAAEDEPTKTT
jgi:dephospho-CoA kinase